MISAIDFNSEFVQALLLSLAAMLLLYFIRVIALRLLIGREDDYIKTYKWRKNSTYLTVFVGVFIVGGIWWEGFNSIATFLGIVSAGLAIALKDPVTDLAGWLFIIWRTPFSVSDRIEIGAFKGDVIDIRLFKFTIVEIGNWVNADQSTGRIIHIPNHKVFTDFIGNYTVGFRFIWNEIPVLITFESNWEKAKTILQTIADENFSRLSIDPAKEIKHAARSYMVFYNILTPTVYTNVKDSGIELTIRHITDPRKRRGAQQEIWENVLKAFAKEEDIDLAYPTYRIVKN